MGLQKIVPKSSLPIMKNLCKHWEKFNVQTVLQNQISPTASNIQQFPPLTKPEQYSSFKEAIKKVIKNPAARPFKIAPTPKYSSQEYLLSQLQVLHKKIGSLKDPLNRLHEMVKSTTSSVNAESVATLSLGEDGF
ncbi:hypothetical protein MRB53_030127 [Persea americana]|uniref:Uncharacterized protein n=1 Tax=Persea americana TaxID=3435 RepID=A0ACC2KKY6_PERAE|nr:hypothetical protein MRB53_030127 [Persea americana]